MPAKSPLPHRKTSETNGIAEVRSMGLRYTTDAKPGIRRRKRGQSFSYSDSSGAPIRDPQTLGRIKSLVIPPAWQEVWICPFENGHLQVTGKDVRGRKQYRYHPDWRAHRDADKFERMIEFARILPRMRRKVDRDLAKRGMGREKVLATVVRLLETTLIRVGNEEYARDNKSYGLTTMRNRHAKVNGTRLEFAFRGKSGKEHEISVHDPKLAKIVSRCQDMPGQELFCYEDETGVTHDISSQDVNGYLKSISGKDFTAKEFRTWAGTVLAAIAFREFESVAGANQAKKNVVTAVEAVSRMLGNTPAVCKKCYIHPVILESYLLGETIETVRQKVSVKIYRSLSQLKPEEAAVLVLLQKKLKGMKSGEKTAKTAKSKV